MTETSQSEPAKQPIVIQINGFANGAECPHAGQFIKEFDHEAMKGVGYGEFTKNPHLAKKFAGHTEAWEFWTKVPKIKPTRPDGQPNKPLTAATVSIIPLDIAILDATARGWDLRYKDTSKKK